jgi:ParB family chromosome partitioning protein
LEQLIPITLVDPDPGQPRKHFDEKTLTELAASIRENGLVQAITVRPCGQRFRIVAGERRWRAHRLIGAETIRCLVKDLRENDAAIAAIIENLQREDIRPLEEARAFQAMLDRGFTPEELARKLGIGQAWRITYRTRLLRLEPEIQRLLDAGAITANAAHEIAKLDPLAQVRVVKRINSGQLRSDAEVSAAVQAVIDKLSQSDFFGGGGKASEDDLAAVRGMEAKVEAVARMVAAGWKDGECIVARKVAADRAAKMADQLAAIRKHVAQMERELRTVAAQAEMAMENDAA